MPVISEEEMTITRATFVKDEIVNLLAKNVESLRKGGLYESEYKYTVSVYDNNGKKVCDDINNITVTRVKERSL